MAAIKTVGEKLGLKELTAIQDKDRDVTDAYVCDLLSWVMAKGEPGSAWITVQTHLNVVAVAALKEFSCIIVPEGIEVPEATVAKAQEEGIAVFSSDQNAYRICRALGSLGVGT